MTKPISIFDLYEAKEIKTHSDPITIKLGEGVEFYIKYGGEGNRTFTNAVNLKMKPFGRRSAMIQKGKLSEDAVKRFEEERERAIAELYTDHVIVGWKGVFGKDGKEIEFNRENCIDLMLKLDPVFAEIITEAGETANFKEKEEAREEANLKKS